MACTVILNSVQVISLFGYIFNNSLQPLSLMSIWIFTNTVSVIRFFYTSFIIDILFINCIQIITHFSDFLCDKFATGPSKFHHLPVEKFFCLANWFRNDYIK